MAQRYKIKGLVTIPSGLISVDVMLIDSPEFEISQGRQSDNTAFIGVMYYYKQGEIDRTAFVEYSIPFSDLSETEMNAIIALITSANINIISMPQHNGAVEIWTLS